jgi:transposase
VDLGTELAGPIDPAQRAAVEARLRARDLPPRERERLEMVKAAAVGWDLAAIAAWCGRSEATVRRWLAAFRDGGPEALADAPRAGRPRRAGDAYLAEQTGVRIAPGWLRVLLHRQRFAHGRPKHSVAHLQDPAEVAACRERLRAAGEKGAGAA